MTGSNLNKDIYIKLQGNWEAKRVLTDNLLKGMSGMAVGKAEISPVQNGNSLSYMENFNIKYNNGFSALGTRAYNFKIEENKLCQYKIFTNNEAILEDTLMYQLNFHSSNDVISSKGSYKCNQDTYGVVYTFINENIFTICYNVIGPGKDYKIQTIFNRILTSLLGDTIEDNDNFL